MTRAGLEQAFRTKVIEHRLETGATGDLSNEVTVECI